MWSWPCHTSGSTWHHRTPPDSHQLARWTIDGLPVEGCAQGAAWTRNHHATTTGNPYFKQGPAIVLFLFAVSQPLSTPLAGVLGRLAVLSPMATVEPWIVLAIATIAIAIATSWPGGRVDRQLRHDEADHRHQPGQLAT